MTASIHTPTLRRRPGFSITELLVVIGIIVLLIGILLVAMGGVRDKGLKLQTETTMKGFAQACDNFQLEHGFYPGIVPEQILAQSIEMGNAHISGMENALLHLMGGAADQNDPRWDNLLPADGWLLMNFDTGTTVFSIKVNKTRIGEGPYINGTQYNAYFAPSDGDKQLGYAADCTLPATPGNPEWLPDLLDAWGQPIIYGRQVRTQGNLVSTGDFRGQFMPQVIDRYVDCTALGEIGLDQTANSGDTRASLFHNMNIDPDALLAQLIRHPGFGAPDEPLLGTSRGSFYLISAGPDGIYYSADQAPEPSTPQNVLDDPRFLSDFDDVLFTGGG